VEITPHVYFVTGGENCRLLLELVIKQRLNLLFLIALSDLIIA
jgi:hypothetical protein